MRSICWYMPAWTGIEMDKHGFPSSSRLPSAPVGLALRADHVLGHVREAGSCLSLCLSSLASLLHLDCSSSSCNAGRARLPSRNVILLPDTQRECVKAEARLVFQGEGRLTVVVTNMWFGQFPKKPGVA